MDFIRISVKEKIKREWETIKEPNVMKENENLNKSENQKSNTCAVRRSIFGVKYLYLDNNTRVRYGFTFKHSGTTYTLQRKGIFWNEVAWTYQRTHIGKTLDRIIEYLKWYEESKKKVNLECLF